MRDLGEVALPTLSDDRLRLRALRTDDKAAVVAACNDPLVVRFCYRVPSPYRDSDFEDWFQAGERRWSEHRLAQWAVADARTDALLASISLEVVSDREAGEIGYYCAPWARRRGVMTAAVRLVRDWAFDELRLERLELATDTENIASQRVAQAAGFRREGDLRGYLTARGERRDHVLFAMLPADPREPAAPLPWPRLSDGRVLVRPFLAEDAPAVLSACADPDIAHWIYDVPVPYTPADAERFIADSLQRLAAGHSARLAVCDAATGELLGSISCDLRRDRQAAEIGYWVRREARRHGFAAAAARLVIAWAFTDLALERLEILTYPGNAASQALAASLGFTREGLLRGFLAVEPGKDRTGRFGKEPPGSGAATAGTALRATVGDDPARDDQVQFSLLRADWHV